MEKTGRSGDSWGRKRCREIESLKDNEEVRKTGKFFVEDKRSAQGHQGLSFCTMKPFITLENTEVGITSRESVINSSRNRVHWRAFGDIQSEISKWIMGNSIIEMRTYRIGR